MLAIVFGLENNYWQCSRLTVIPNTRIDQDNLNAIAALSTLTRNISTHQNPKSELGRNGSEVDRTETSYTRLNISFLLHYQSLYI